MSKKKRKPLPRIGGKAVVPKGPTEVRSEAAAVQLGAEGLLGTGIKVQVAGSGRKQESWEPFNQHPMPEMEFKARAVEIRATSDNLPRGTARRIIAASENLTGRERDDKYTDEEVQQIITDNPALALEGLSKMGKVLVMPTDKTDAPVINALEIKARVVKDLREGRINYPHNMIDAARGQIGTSLHHLLPSAVYIDVQAVYERWLQESTGSDLYELKMAPPWSNALLVYNTPVGNVWTMFMTATDMKNDLGWDNDPDTKRSEARWDPQPPATHTIEWDDVRWVYSILVYLGGTGQSPNLGTPSWIPTTGPVMVWKAAVYEDGTLADLHWTHVVEEIPFHKFNNALGVLTETINMCNCVNVTVAYPTRSMPRAQRRRMDRLGVRFSEIHIRPTSKSYRDKGVALADMEMPVHGVRGHFAEYGVNGKGLLFGKLTGRYWIPPHVRGSEANGVVEHEYKVEP